MLMLGSQMQSGLGWRIFRKISSGLLQDFQSSTQLTREIALEVCNRGVLCGDESSKANMEVEGGWISKVSKEGYGINLQKVIGEGWETF